LFKVVSLSPLPEGVVQGFLGSYIEQHHLEAKVVGVQGLDSEQIKKELRDADFVIGDYSFSIPITADVVEVMTKVRLIQQPSTGYEHIDVEACAKKGIPVANIGGANSISVAEHTITLALMLTKRAVYGHEKLLADVWTQDELMNQAGELYEKTWGVIGLGRIGRMVASRAAAFGMKVVYFDARPLSPEEEMKWGVSFRPLPRLLSEADVVSIHVPLTEQTKRMIGERELRLMRPSAVFVNPSRGELVDEEALARAVSEGWIAGAGVDVFSKEPPGQDHPLLVAAKEGANLVLTPHIAGATNEARLRIIQVTIENVVRVMLGQSPENVVNR
jgi:phosphoglycerate dehydrogenase-like enzyme